MTAATADLTTTLPLELGDLVKYAGSLDEFRGQWFRVVEETAPPVALILACMADRAAIPTEQRRYSIHNAATGVQLDNVRRGSLRVLAAF